MRTARARAPCETKPTRLHLEEECRVRSIDRKMSSSSERSAKKTARQAYSWTLRAFHADGPYDSRGSCWHAHCAGGGGCHLPGNRNVAGPPAISAPWAPRASQQKADAHPRNRRRHTDCGLRIVRERVLPELDAGAAVCDEVRSRGKLRSRQTRLERSGARATHGSANRP